MRPEMRLAIVLLAMPVPGYTVETLLYEDFQDRDSEGWRGFGDGAIGITEYQDNASLQLRTGNAVARQVSLAGVSRIRVGASIAASDLGDHGACVAEITLDAGGSWSDVSRVVSGQDDGLTLHSDAISLDVKSADGGAWIRASVMGSSRTARCWLDNVFVVGERTAISSAETISARQLSLAFLLGDDDSVTATSMWEFAQLAGAKAPLHNFSGSLKLRDVANTGHMNIVRDDWGRRAEIGEPIAHLPEFDFEFAQQGGDLIPLQRGVRRREHPYWEIILQPGRAWTEVNDGGWTRAAIPFSLQERAANCTHNGVLTWLFDDHRVTRVAYQISSETCGYLQLDMWGVAAAEYTPLELSDKSAAAFLRFDSHRRSRLPVKPITALALDYPGVEPLSFGVDDGIRPDDMTVHGIVVDGANYRSDCRTRRGPYPYCASLPLPSFSTAKSIFAGIALMRLEKLFPGMAQTSIASQIAACDTRKWRGVTVENALDMATGNYRSNASGEDEDAAAQRSFVFDGEHRSKLEFACGNYRRKARPGTRFVYHTSDTYLVGTALQAAISEQTSGESDLYRSVLVDPVWRQLKLSVLLDDSKRTYDNFAQPFAGYGLTYELDDIVRIASWLSNDNATLDGEQVLDDRMLSASLQRSPEDRGLDAAAGNLKYNNGFWAFDAGPSLGCEHAVWTPFMSGVSGITVALFPNGVIYYYFSDSYVFRWQSGREAAHTIRSMCQ